MKRHPIIENHSEFKAILCKAVVRTDELAALDPSFKLPSVIRPQLDFMSQVLKENRVSAPEERARINIGVIAVRNFDDSDPEYATWLKALDHAFKNWEQLSKT
jgi:hypothetical protein